MSGWMWRMGHKIYKDAIDLTRMAIQTGLLLLSLTRSFPFSHFRFSHFRPLHPQLMMTDDEEVAIVAETMGFVKGLGTKVVRFACQDGRATLFLSLIYGGQ